MTNLISFKVSDALPESVKKIIRPFYNKLSEWQMKRRLLRLYANFLQPGDLVFDVGAHIGFMTDVFLNLGTSIVCIEPQPYCTKILRDKYGNNDRVMLVEKGLSDKPGKLSLLICDQKRGLTTFSKKWKTGRYAKQVWNREIEVLVITLDSLIRVYGTPRYCKIDVEGYELNVLKGLTKKIPFISFEFTKEFLKDAKKIAIHLEKVGNVEFNFCLYHSFRFTSKSWMKAGEMFRKLDTRSDKYLSGDIFCRFS